MSDQERFLLDEVSEAPEPIDRHNNDDWKWWWRKWLPRVGIAAIVIVVLLSALPSRKPVSRRTLCKRNLYSIAKACRIYAEANRGPLPPSLDVVLIGGERAYVQPSQLVCPVDKSRYIYISGQTNRDDPRNVVAYEPPSNHLGKEGKMQWEGANAAFLDGQVRWLTPDQLQAEIAATRARIKAAATRPALKR